MIALRQGLSEYFRFYNDERPHNSLGLCTPSEIYNGLRVMAAWCQALPWMTRIPYVQAVSMSFLVPQDSSLTPLSLQVSCHQEQCLSDPIIGHYLKSKGSLSHGWGPLQTELSKSPAASVIKRGTTWSHQYTSRLTTNLSNWKYTIYWIFSGVFLISQHINKGFKIDPNMLECHLFHSY